MHTLGGSSLGQEMSRIDSQLRGDFLKENVTQ